MAEAAVIGKKDPGRGEVVVAFVRKGGAIAHRRSITRLRTKQGLPGGNPARSHGRPRPAASPTGKVLKRMLSERVNAPA